ncbi:MAG: DUF368 domain-containing protein, partial [Polyangiaceae bacterium]
MTAGQDANTAKESPPKDAAAADELGDISWSDAPYIVGSGMCMGTADVVPGVSGGTMAVALGIYQR